MAASICLAFARPTTSALNNKDVPDSTAMPYTPPSTLNVDTSDHSIRGHATLAQPQSEQRGNAEDRFTSVTCDGHTKCKAFKVCCTRSPNCLRLDRTRSTLRVADTKA